MYVAIVDDSSEDCEILCGYLKKCFSQKDICIPLEIESFKSGEDFLKSFSAHSFEIVFMDYYMSGITGLATAVNIRKTDKKVKIIFTTTSKDHAIDGYKVCASGYLVKPYSYSSLYECISLLDAERIKKQQIIKICSCGQTFRILLSDIIYCDVCGHYIQIHTKNLGLYKIRISFSNFTLLLSPYSEFLLCNRGCFVNMNHIAGVDEFVFIMDNGERIPFRQREHQKLLQAYSKFIFDKVRNEDNEPAAFL